jgi:hypothetical protein
MLTEIALENFKPFGTRQVAPLAPITLVYGPNSGGKSSLIQALMLLKQSMTSSGDGSGLIPRGEYVDLGSFKALLHKHETSRSLYLGLKYERVPLLQHGSLRGGNDQHRDVGVTFKVAKTPGSRRKDSSHLTDVEYALSGEPGLRAHLVREEGQASSLTGPVFRWASTSSAESLVKCGLELQKRIRERVKERRGGGRTSDDLLEAPDAEQLAAVLMLGGARATGFLPDRLDLFAVPEEADLPLVSDDVGSGLHRSRRQNLMKVGQFLSGLAGEFYGLLESVSYLGPLRSHPARHYLVLGAAKDTVGVRGENTPQLIFHRKQILNTLNDWFLQFEIPYRLKVSSVGDDVTGEIVVLNLVDGRTGVQVAPSDVGFGIGQLLPIIVEGVVAKRRTICVEQPEIHLHPRLQAHVADLLIATAGLRDRSSSDPWRGPHNQWLIETHSEAIILRLQRRIREGKISHRDISVLYVEPSVEGSRVIPLALNPSGDFVDEWPGGFFEEGYHETFATRGPE